MPLLNQSCSRYVLCSVYDGELDTEAEGEADTEAEGEDDTDADGEAEGEADTEAEGEADTEAEGDADGEADTEAEGEAEGEADTEADGEADIEADGELDAEVSTPIVCVSVAKGRTIQLVPSEIASSIPPIFSPLTANPMLSAVRSLNTTSPLVDPATIMFWSAILTNNTHWPLFVLPAAGRVNVTPLLPRVVSTEPKSFGVTV